MEPIKGWTMSYAEVYHNPTAKYFIMIGEPQKTYEDYLEVKTSCIVSPEEYMRLLYSPSSRNQVSIAEG